VREARDVMSRIAAEIADCLACVRPESLEAALSRIQAAPRVFVAGAGRSGFMVRGFAMRLMHAGKIAHVVGEPTTPAVAPGIYS